MTRFQNRIFYDLFLAEIYHLVQYAVWIKQFCTDNDYICLFNKLKKIYENKRTKFSFISEIKRKQFVNFDYLMTFPRLLAVYFGSHHQVLCIQLFGCFVSVCSIK